MDKKYDLFLGDGLLKLRTIQNETVDLILTDPPFGQAINYGRSQLGHRTIKNDCNLLWLEPWAAEAFRILKDCAHCVVFWQWRTYSVLEEIMLAQGFELKTVAIWDKGNAGLGDGLAEQYEQIAVFKKGKARQNFFRGNVFRYPRIAGRPEHPHQKPDELLSDLLLLCSDEGDLVVDSFMGSGSTGVACMKQNRLFVGCEIEAGHFDLAQSRIVTEAEFQETQPKLFKLPEPTQAEITFE